MKSSSSVPAQEGGNDATSLRRRENGSLSSNADLPAPGKENWDARVAFNSHRYFGPEVWQDRDSKDLRAGMRFTTSAETPSWHARGALSPPRARDFESVQHVDGVSPEWPLKYRDWESLVRTRRANSITSTARRAWIRRPWRTITLAAVSHEPPVAEITEALRAQGLTPQLRPRGAFAWKQPHLSPCIRCSTCDGYRASSTPSRTPKSAPSTTGPGRDERHDARRGQRPNAFSPMPADARSPASGYAPPKGEQVVFINSAALLPWQTTSIQTGWRTPPLLGRNLMKHVLVSVRA